MSGGGGFGFSQSKQKSDPFDLTSPEASGLRSPLASVLAGLLGVQEPFEARARRPGDDVVTSVTPTTVGTPGSIAGIPAYQGQYAAPLGANEQAVLQQLMTQTQPGSDPYGAGQYLQQSIAGQYTDPGSNPFLQSYIEAATRGVSDQYERVLGRTLPGQFTQAGQQVQPGGSSAFDYAAAQEATGFANALKDIATNIGFGAYEAERGRQQQSAGEAIGLNQQEVQNTLSNLQAQALPRLIEQYGLDQGLSEFQRQNDQLQQILAIIAGVQAPTPTSQGRGSSLGIQAEGKGGIGPSGG